MKKKLITIVLAILVLSVVAISLVACNRATTQGQLSNFLVDHDNEVYVYDVTNELTGETGTYTVNVKMHAAGDTINCPDTIENVGRGVFVESQLSIGTVEYSTGCYFTIVRDTALMTPAYTYRVQKENGNETFRMKGSYNGQALVYERVINGVVSKGGIKLSGTYFDNNEFHQSLRTVTTFSTNFSFSYVVPLVSANEIAAVTLSARCTQTAYVKTPFTETIDAENGVKCYNVRISRSTKVAGVDQSLYYATESLKANNSSFKLKNVLVKFYEPITTEEGTKYIIYSLKSANILP